MKRKVQKQKPKKRLPVKQQRESSKEQEQKQSSKEQEQRQSVNVVVNLAEKKQMKKRVYKRKTKKQIEEPTGTELFRPLPPVVYMTPPQITNYLIPQERPAERPRITEMKPIENPRSSLEIEDIRPLEFFPFGDEFPAEKEIKIVKKEPATSTKSPSPAVAPSPILQMEAPSPASSTSPILQLEAPSPARTILEPPKFETGYSREYASSSGEEYYILPPKPKKKSAKKKSTEKPVKAEKVEEFGIEIPLSEGKKVSELNILGKKAEKQPSLEKFGFKSESESIPVVASPRARGRPSGPFPNLGQASKQMLQSIYKIEFGKDADPSMKRNELLDYIKTNRKPSV
jgi:hypothetical protein